MALHATSGAIPNDVFAQPWRATASGPDGDVQNAWVSLAFGDQRMTHRALVLFQSLRDVGTAAACVLLCDPCEASREMRAQATSLGVRVRRTVPPIAPDDMPAHYKRMLRRRGVPLNSYAQGVSDFVKLVVHSLTDYACVVLLDGDVLALQHVDQLFRLPDGSHSDGPLAPFNAGVVVIRPSRADFLELLAIARRAKFNESRGWHDEGPCTRKPCNARHITQGLWHWWYVTRPQWHAPLLSRHVYNALHDAPPAAGGDSFESIRLAHFTNCGKPQAEGCRSTQLFAPWHDHVHVTAHAARFRQLCERARRRWAAAHARLCSGTAHGVGMPPRSLLPPPPPPPQASSEHSLVPGALHVLAHAAGMAHSGVVAGVVERLKAHDTLCNRRSGARAHEWRAAPSALAVDLAARLRTDCLYSLSTADLGRALRSNASGALTRRLGGASALVVHALVAEPLTWFVAASEQLRAGGADGDAAGALLARSAPFFDAPSPQTRSFAWRRRRGWALTLRLHPATHATVGPLTHQLVNAVAPPRAPGLERRLHEHLAPAPALFGGRQPSSRQLEETAAARVEAAHARNLSRVLARINGRCRCDFAADDVLAMLADDAQLYGSLDAQGAELRLDAHGELAGISGFGRDAARPVRALLRLLTS